MSDAFIGLTPESKLVIENYFAWGKAKREKFERDLSFQSENFAHGNVFDNTFSQEDVKTKLRAHLELLKVSLNEEASYQSMAAAQLMRSVLLEADKQRIPIPVDPLAVLNNMAGTNALEAAESRMFSQGPKGKLQPLSGVDTGNETAKQLAAAHQEIRALNDKVRVLQEQHSRAMADRANTHAMAGAADNRADSAALNSQLTMQQSQAFAQTMEVQLQECKMQLLASQKEMGEKLARSAQFQNLQQMLRQKNDTVKAMRVELQRYDPAAAARIAGNTDDFVEDEDED